MLVPPIPVAAAASSKAAQVDAPVKRPSAKRSRTPPVVRRTSTPTPTPNSNGANSNGANSNGTGKKKAAARKTPLQAVPEVTPEAAPGR